MIGVRISVTAESQAAQSDAGRVWQLLDDRFLTALQSFLSNTQKQPPIQILHTRSAALMAKHHTLRSSFHWRDSRTDEGRGGLCDL